MALDFDFASFNEIKNAVNNSGAIKYTLIGGQGIAITFVIIKLIHNFTKDTFGGQKQITNIIETFGVIFLISIAPYTMDIIDNAFAWVDKEAFSFDGSGKFPTALKDNLKDLFEEKEESGLLGLLDTTLPQFIFDLFRILIGLIGFLIWAIDSAIYSIFIIERMILLEIYRFVFPLMLAFAGIDGLRDKYYKWVTGFIGILLLPIPYIAVHNTIDIITKLTIDKNNSDNALMNGLILIVVLITSAGMKYKLLSSVTKKMTEIF